MATRQGTEFPVEQATERTWTPKKGWRTNRVWMGSDATITALAAQIQAESGAFVNMTLAPQDGGVSRLTVTFDDVGDGAAPVAEANGEPEADNDTWTLQGNDYEKDLWSHPVVAQLANDCPDEYDWLRKNLGVVQKNGTWKDVLDAYTANAQCDQDVKAIFKMFRDGVENYSVSQYVLRRSRTIKNRAEGAVSVDNVGNQFTLVQLRNNEGVPATLVFALPADGAWIKRTPTVNYDGNKLSVENEYWHADSWETLLYPAI
jgi:hypothetical protein